MSIVAGLVEVDWAAFDGDRPYYRACDICFNSASDDACTGKPISSFRAFYRDVESGLNLCEHCVGRFLCEQVKEAV